jgi:hypothetical protein
MTAHVLRTPLRSAYSARYTTAWFGLAATGIANGAARVALYEGRVGEQVAHQLSTASAVALFTAYAYLVDRRWPFAGGRDAALVGAGWAAATVAFEFGFGHYVAADSWSTLLHDYNLAAGRTWPLAVATIAVAPALVRRIRLRRRR